MPGTTDREAVYAEPGELWTNPAGFIFSPAQVQEAGRALLACDQATLEAIHGLMHQRSLNGGTLHWICRRTVDRMRSGPWSADRVS